VRGLIARLDESRFISSIISVNRVLETSFGAFAAGVSHPGVLSTNDMLTQQRSPRPNASGMATDTQWSALPRRQCRGKNRERTWVRFPALVAQCVGLFGVQPLISLSLRTKAVCGATKQPARHVYGYWKDQENRTRMPTERELRVAGRTDMTSALRRHGGWERNAREAGLTLTSIAKPRSIYLTFCTKMQPGTILRPHNYWAEFENLRNELMSFVRERRKSPSREKDASLVTSLSIPTTRELEYAKRHDLVRAIRKHGGAELVAKRLDLRFRYHSPGYWKKFDNVAKVRQLFRASFAAFPSIYFVTLARAVPPDA
jgi:hypothetical protein